jgi:predicted transcriptional regulator
VDPVTLILIAAGGVAASGVLAAAGPLWRHWRQRVARELLQRPVIGARAGSDAPRSVYDVYRDLGSDEFAIEVMDHLHVIPEKEEDLEAAAVNLGDAISSFGGYETMIGSLRETIEEMADEQGRGVRREIGVRLTLNTPYKVDSLLPSVDRPRSLPPGEEIKQLEARTASSRAAQPTGEARDGASGLHATVDEALAQLFGSRSPHAGALQDGSGGLAAIVIGGVLGSLTTGGNFWDGVSRFVHRRRVKQMRSKLNDQLSGLSLDHFHAAHDVARQVEQNLALVTQNKRWELERRRRELKKYRAIPRRKRSTAQLALKQLALEEAREVMVQTERDVKKLKAQITRHRRSGRHDLAGFLIYVNRADLLHGVGFFDERIHAIEDAGEQLRQALLAEVPTSGSANEE